MVDVATGVLTNGLGGDATAMILGRFHMGYFDVTITPKPPEPPIPPTGGNNAYGGGDYPQQTLTPDSYVITFNIERKGMKWNKSYVVHRKQGLILIKVTNMLNTISDRINFTVTNIRKKIGNIGIKIWNK